MNENEQNISNGPYKAVGNLNTVIGNPNININSAVTSNIMDGNRNDFISKEREQSILDNNNVLNNEFASKNLTVSSYSDKTVIDNTINKDSVQNFIKETKNDADFNVLNNNIINDFSSNNVANGDSSNYTSTEAFSSNTKEEVKLSNVEFSSSDVKYENVYQTTKKGLPKKKAFRMPDEFKTAIFVVLILLIIVSCFESVYDFFRNLNIFG